MKFHDVIQLFYANPVKAKNFLNDSRLTQYEKIILRCFYLIKDNQISALTKELKAIRGNINPFSLCMKKLLEGLSSSVLGNDKMAIKKLNSLLPTLQSYELPQIEFNIHHTLFKAYFNLKHSEGMEHCLRQMYALKAKPARYQLHQWICQFHYHTYHRHYQKSELLIKKIDQNLKHMHESDLINYLLDKFDYYIKLEDFTKAEFILNQMKDIRTPNFTSHYNYMKLLLNHFIQHSPLYFQDHEFIHHTSLYWKICLIRSFEENQKDAQLKIWGELNHLYPEQFAEPFRYTGDKNLFSICLDKYVRRDPHVSTDEAVEQFDSNQKIDVIVSILKKSHSPICKEELFAQVWGRFLVSKDDSKILTSAISKAKQKYSINIKMLNGSYYIDRDKKVS